MEREIYIDRYRRANYRVQAKLEFLEPGGERRFKCRMYIHDEFVWTALKFAEMQAFHYPNLVVLLPRPLLEEGVKV